MVWISGKSFWEINTLSAGMPLTPNLLESWSTRGSPKGTASQLPAVKGLWIPYLGCSWNFSLFPDTVFTKSIKHYHKDRYGFWGNSDEGTCDWKQLPKIDDFREGLTNHEPLSYNPSEPLHCGLTTQRSPPPGCLRLVPPKVVWAGLELGRFPILVNIVPKYWEESEGRVFVCVLWS